MLGLLAAGHSNKEIAAQLFLSERTVERHITTVYRKIGTRRRTEAMAFALRHGLADVEEDHLRTLVRERLGGLHSARLVLGSVDFADIEPLQAAGRWDEAAALLAETATTWDLEDPATRLVVALSLRVR